MTDLLFVEFGAVVIEIRNRSRCIIELFCDPRKTAFDPKDRIDIDFELSLDEVLRRRGSAPVATAAQRASYYQYVKIAGHGSTSIGPSWPGGGYEGIVCIREDVVKANPLLARAAAALPGRPWEHHVIVSIDDATGDTRCYHGFHAEVIQDDGGALVLEVAHAGASMQSSVRRTIPYDLTRTEAFYAGDRVADNIVRRGGSPSGPRTSGAVFMAPEAAVNFGVESPKLPVAAEDQASADPPAARPRENRAAPRARSLQDRPVDETRTVVAITANPTDLFQQLLKAEIDVEVGWKSATGDDPAAIETQRRTQVHDLFAGAEVVDLVGHSTPIHGYLKLGDCIVDPRAAGRLASYMPPTVKRVRVIGCSTATRDAGRAAIGEFAQHGLSAYGTVNKVYLAHFDKRGVKRGIGGPPLAEVLPDSSAQMKCVAAAPCSGSRPGPPLPPPVDPASPPPVTPAAKRAASGPSRSVILTDAPAVVADWHAGWTLMRALRWVARCVWSIPVVLFALLRRAYLHFVAKESVPQHWIWTLLSPWSTELPGLLTEPLLTYQITSGAKTWTLEILFDFEFAHFYASTDSLALKQRVYRIVGSKQRAKAMLESYLEQSRHGVALVRRHEEAGSRGGVMAERAGGSSRSESRSRTR